MHKAVFREIPFDQHTPITAYQALSGRKGSVLLESSPGYGRYSFVGIDPMAALSGNDGAMSALRTFRQEFPVEADHPLALYAGACIGYAAYDGSYAFQIYRSGAVFDHQEGRAALFTLGDPRELDILSEKLNGPRFPELSLQVGSFAPDKSDEEFVAMVERAKGHLRAGDVFQIVLSRTFTASFAGNPLDVYRALRKKSPAPYLFFFDLEECAIAGASPEKLISVQDGVVESMPIAGTRREAEGLLEDPKEAAEHVMLVDLARNDVGAVSEPGSVAVAEFRAVRKFSRIAHIVSRVVGKLAPGRDAPDAFEAVFPAGTLSGAPKIRAMELIEEIEQSPRGLYGGAIVSLDTKGNLTSCIAIRMAEMRGGEISVRAGAGIVIDSDPLKEAEETRLKANTIMEALV